MSTGSAAAEAYWRDLAEAFSEEMGEPVSVPVLRCGLGDHRRCGEDCEHAQRWHAIILATAREALARTGRRVAVMCVHDECRDGIRPRLLATVVDNWSGTGLRNSHWKRAHDGYSLAFGAIEMKGVVYLVDSEPSLRIR